MRYKEALIKGINLSPDFIIKQLSDIVHYIKQGAEIEYL